MKLTLIKYDDVVISREEYRELLMQASKPCEKACRELHCAILNCSAKYECEEMQGCYYVFVSGENVVYPIKRFDSDDPDYNRVCAEELVELLNQEQ